MRSVTARWLVLAMVVGGAAWWATSGPEPAAAEEKAGKLPAELQRIPVKSAGLVSVRPSQLWNSALGKGVRDKVGKDLALVVRGVEKTTGLSPAQIERVTIVLPRVRTAGEPLLFVAATEKVEREKLLDRLVPGGTEKTYAGQKYVKGKTNRAVVLFDDRAFAVGQEGEIQSMIDAARPREEIGLSAAVQLAAGKHAVVCAVNVDALGDVKEELPEELAAFRPLLKASLVTVTVDLGATVEAKVQARFAAAGDAAAAVKPVETLRTLALGGLARGVKELSKDGSLAPLVALIEDLQGVLKTAKLHHKGTTLTADLAVKGDARAITGAALSAISRVRVAAQRQQSASNLKQIGLAMHNYHDAHKALPPTVVFDKDGKPLLSWRVLLLPYLAQDELYKQFKLDQPWDSPHNRKLLEKMPAIFKCPNGKNTQPYGTFYQVFVGKNAAFEGKRGLTFASFSDGLSNTILAAEASKDVPWTKPEDIPFDADKAVPKLGASFKEGFNALLADGSVRFVSRSIKESTLKLLITRNDGQPVPADF